MNHLNSTLIEGCITEEPLLRSVCAGIDTYQFTIASNRFFKKETGIEKEVNFFQIRALGELGKACQKQGRKGREVRVVGRLKQISWIDIEGEKYPAVIIEAEHVEIKSVKEGTKE